MHQGESGAPSDIARVFYIDYGNTAAIPWANTARFPSSRIWGLKPMAVPFSLTEPIENLKSHELSNLFIEVQGFGTFDEGLVIGKALSFASELSSQSLVNSAMKDVGDTVIM